VSHGGPRHTLACHYMVSPTAARSRRPYPLSGRKGTGLHYGGVVLHILGQSLRYARVPDIGGKEAREQMAARASPRLFTPQGV
jgi:hypothetical protein